MTTLILDWLILCFDHMTNNHNRIQILCMIDIAYTILKTAIMNDNNFGIRKDLGKENIKNNFIRGDNILLRNILEKDFYLKNLRNIIYYF
jgi:hypothetical protein